MRETDYMNHNEHDELRDIHRRIDALKEESERQYGDLKDKLHNLEVAIARGARFPASAWSAVAAVVISVIGTGAVLYSELQINKHNATRALTVLESHMKDADEMQRNNLVLQERIGHLEARADHCECFTQPQPRQKGMQGSSGMR